MMEIQWNVLINTVLASTIFSVIGLVLFGITFAIIQKVTPFSLRKEIEEDHNTSLGIVIGSVIIGIALIVSAAMGG